MKRTVLAALLTPLAAFAVTPVSDGPAQPEGGRRIERMAQALKLDPVQTQKVTTAMQPFIARQKAIREQVKSARQTLRAAAEGDQSAFAKVDSAEQQLLDARAAKLAIQREMIQTVGQGLTPQQRAKLDLFISRDHGRMHGRHGKWGGRGEGREE
jgi:Spy/CpxP family protein refolding chaperone